MQPGVFRNPGDEKNRQSTGELSGSVIRLVYPNLESPGRSSMDDPIMDGMLMAR